MSHHENAYFVDTQLITCHAIPLIPAFHTTPMPTRQTPLTARSQHLPKHLSSPCLTAIPYRFAMASMAIVKELFSTSILRNSFVAFLQ